MKYHQKLATGTYFKDYVLFHEYFHGDTGRGVGTSHQIGWTGLAAKLLQPRKMKVETSASKPSRSGDKPGVHKHELVAA